MSHGRLPLLTMARMISRPGAQSTAALVLPAAAYAITTALVTVVLGGLHAFLTDERLSHLVFFAAFAVVLLVVPLVSLGAAAARLSTRRRDDRLATLRLLGVSSVSVSALAVIETAVVAGVGALAGLGLAFALTPLVGLVWFAGAPIGMAALWLPVGQLAAILAGIILIAALSAVFSLSAVRVTPLGVRTRSRAPKAPYVALAVSVVAVVIVVAMVSGLASGMQAVAQVFGIVGAIVVVVGLFAAGMAVINLVGRPIVAIVGRAIVRRATGARDILVGRRLMEDPRSAWRAVSSVAMIAFVGAILGPGIAMMSMISADASAEDRAFVGDVMTGMTLTIVLSFIMLACSVGVTQAARVIDQRDLIVALDRIGVSNQLRESVRWRTVAVPLAIGVVLGGGIGVMLGLPFVGAAMILAPLSVAVLLATFAMGVACVWLAVLATRPIVTAVRRSPSLV